jgi:hypothetical protein
MTLFFTTKLRFLKRKNNMISHPAVNQKGTGLWWICCRITFLKNSYLMFGTSDANFCANSSSYLL